MLCNQSSRFYCDADEVQGLIATLEILGAHQLRYPRDFMLVFKSMLFEEYEGGVNDQMEGA